jgi:membrane-associated phospholipid phosphatase
MGMKENRPTSAGASAQPGRGDGSVRWLALGLFMVGLPLLMAALRWDDALWGFRGEPLEGAWLRLAKILSASANGGVLIPAGVAAATGLAWRRRCHAARWVLAMVLAGSIAGLSGTLLRSFVGRARPLAHVAQGWHGPRVDGHWVVGKHAYGAFPSGHTSLAAGFGAFLFLHRRRSGVLGLAYAAAVGWSRVELGAHRPSDVVAGLMVGSSVTLLVGPPILARLASGCPDKPVDGGRPAAAT